MFTQSLSDANLDAEEITARAPHVHSEQDRRGRRHGAVARRACSSLDRH